jgi:hypothetical protein
MSINNWTNGEAMLCKGRKNNNANTSQGYQGNSSSG